MEKKLARALGDLRELDLVLVKESFSMLCPGEIPSAHELGTWILVEAGVAGPRLEACGITWQLGKFVTLEDPIRANAFRYTQK